VLLEAARFESDTVSLKGLCPRPGSLHFMSTTSLAHSTRGPITHLMLMILLSGLPSSPDPSKAAYTVQKALDYVEEWFVVFKMASLN